MTRFLTVFLSFGIALAAFLVLRGPAPATPAGAVPALGAARTPQGADAEIARLQAAVRAEPRDVAPRVGLASAYLQKARATGDPSFYTRADGLLRAARAAPGPAGRARRERRARALATRLPRRAGACPPRPRRPAAGARGLSRAGRRARRARPVRCGGARAAAAGRR